MALKQTTPQRHIEQFLQDQIQRREKAIINALDYIGIYCTNEARNEGKYIDRTGNLRASIGYLIVSNGAIVRNGMMSDNEGGQQGSEFLRELAAKFPHGIALIVVAGMSYAAHVEAISLNVLTSAELLAEQMVPGLLKQLGFTTP